MIESIFGSCVLFIFVYGYILIVTEKLWRRVVAKHHVSYKGLPFKKKHNSQRVYLWESQEKKTLVHHVAVNRTEKGIYLYPFLNIFLKSTVFLSFDDIEFITKRRVCFKQYDVYKIKSLNIKIAI